MAYPEITQGFINDPETGQPKRYISLDEAINYKSRPSVYDTAEIKKIAEYYGAGILQEPETVGQQGLFGKMPFFIRTPEGITTEDAEVVSIETAQP